MKNVVFLPTARSTPVRNPDGLPVAQTLAVIIPTLNERDNILPLISALDAALADIPCELVFVDDWSSDGTYQLLVSIARIRPDVRVIGRQGRRGLSSAVIEGVMATSADLVAVIDADMQHDEAILGRMFDAVRGGDCDIAIGTRYSSGGSCGEWDQSRARMSRMATRMAHVALPDAVSDPMSGFFLLRRETFVEMVPQLSRKGFKILLDLLLTAPTPLRVAEIPYTFRCREAGESKLSASVMLSFALLLLHKTFRRFVSARFVMFCLVGLLGVVVHLTVLRSMLFIDNVNFAVAQGSAVATAIGVNFLLNNAVTYRDRRLHGWQFLAGAASFYAVCGLGAIANVGVGSLIYSGHHRWWVAGVAGAVVGSAWNFMASSALTWRRR